jgi:heme/copper-type cytochrome/quinol oxidase subunit 2
MELILSFPAIAWMMAIYFSLSFRAESAVQNPEKLYREPRLMIALAVSSALIVFLLFVRMPALGALFPPSSP